MKLDIDPLSRPVWTGGQRRLIDVGQLSRFNKRFKDFEID